MGRKSKKEAGRVALVGGSYPGPDIEDRVFAGIPVDEDPDDPEAAHLGWIDFGAGDDLGGLPERVLESLAANGIFGAVDEPAADEGGTELVPAADVAELVNEVLADLDAVMPVDAGTGEGTEGSERDGEPQ
jgi:hypothetical protein